MALQFRRMLFSGSSTSGHSVVHSNENYYSNDENNIADWTIPHQNIESIYRIGVMNFKTAFSVRSHEETLNLNREQQTLQLLSTISLNKYQARGYRYIHLGLIQVSIKPLARKGIDTPMFVSLRDDRLKNL